MAAVNELAAKATKIICVGTCSAYGGIPAGAPNPTTVKGVKALTGKTTINVPGCPPHPDSIVWTIAQLLAGQNITVDSYGRPTALYGSKVHSTCPRRNELGHQQTNQLACQFRLQGEKHPTTARPWNNGVNWCIGGTPLPGALTAHSGRLRSAFSTKGRFPLDMRVSTKVTCTACHGRS
jgi:Ni,Fe-hydrogenase I small subunit